MHDDFVTQDIEIPAEFKRKNNDTKKNIAPTSKTTVPENPDQKKSTKKEANKNMGKESGKRAFHLTLLKLSAVVFGILLIAFLALNAFGDVTFFNVMDGFSSFFEKFSPGDGYPCKIETNSLKDVNISGSKLVTLSKDSSTVYNSTAKKVLNLQHTYTNPVMKTKNGRVIIFDRGSGRFMVQNMSKLICEKKMENDILTAAIGKNGSYAVATRSDTAASVLTVFDKKQKEIFVWKCSTEYISDISLSDDGKTAVVSVVGSKNAEVYSKIHIFEFDHEEVLASFDFDLATIFSVSCSSKNKITAYGNNLRVVIEKNKITENESLETDTFTAFYRHESGKTVLVRSPFGGSGKRLVVYDSKGKLLFEKDIEKSPKSISCDLNYIVALYEHSVEFYSNSGELIKSIDVPSNGVKVVTNGGTAYVVSNSDIEQFKVSD